MECFRGRTGSGRMGCMDNPHPVQTGMKRLVWNRHVKTVLKHAAGWLCLAAGILMLITPGQGLLTILLGIFLLADEIPLFGRIRDRLQHRFPRAADYLHRKRARISEIFNRGKK